MAQNESKLLRLANLHFFLQKNGQIRPQIILNKTKKCLKLPKKKKMYNKLKKKNAKKNKKKEEKKKNANKF